METIRNAFTALTAVTEQGHDTAAAVALGVGLVVMVLVWAAAESLLPSRRSAVERDRDALARTVGVLRDRHDPAYDGEFAQALKARLDDERGQGDTVFLTGVVIVALYFLALAVVLR